MDVRTITPNVSVSGQVQPEELAELRERGFKAIICNRPDGEEAGQPAWAEIEAAAHAAGLDAAYLPIRPGELGEEQALLFRDLVTGFEKPVLAFCRSGTRSAQLWALAARDRLSTEEVIRMAATAGYDLSGMRERLETAG